MTVDVRIFKPMCRAQLSVIFDGRGAPHSKPLTLEVTPKSCSVHRNGYHEADTWTMEFDSRLLPFDVDGIASMSVRIYMWDGYNTEQTEWATPDNEMIRGLVDDPEAELVGSQTISFSGRDYTASLDQEWDPRVRIPSGGPLDQVVQKIADDAAPERSQARFQVIWQSPEPIPNAFSTARSTKKKGAWVKPGKTTWEVIYDLVIAHGFITYIVDSTIYIASPMALLEERMKYYPTIVHGRDLSSLRISRKLAKERVPQMKVVYWDASLRKKFEVVYPEKGRPPSVGVGFKKDEFEIVPAPSYCHDRDSALRFARMRYELIARGESEYTFETRAMTVPYGEGVNAAVGEQQSLLGLRAGLPISVKFEPFNLEHIRALSIGERYEHLRTMGYTSAIAAFVARNVERITQFQQPYYIRNVTFDWSTDDGLKISGTGVNYASERRELAWEEGTLPEIEMPPQDAREI